MGYSISVYPISVLSLSGGGGLRPSVYADVRCIDDVIADHVGGV